MNEKKKKTQEEKSIPVKGAKFHCNYCNLDISGLTRIKCAECKDFDLCVDCFYVGVETMDHKMEHKYSIMDDMSAPLYTTTCKIYVIKIKGGAEEELLLLEGIEIFGLGNWSDIAGKKIYL
jgi:transcriptional adapter 2-alpha